MPGILTRRSLLAGAGHTAAFGTLTTRRLSVAEAQIDRLVTSAARNVLNDLIGDARKFTTIIPGFNELHVQAIV